MGSRVFKPTFILEVMAEVLPYLGVTFLIVIATLFFSTIIGLLLARAKIRGRFGKYLADGYTVIFRCVPTIVLLFLVYYGLPQLLKGAAGIDINGWNKGIFVVLAFSLIFGASLGEIMRAAYHSVESTQCEAALCVGLSGTQTFFRIIFPQAVRYALPNLANVITGLMKEGALAYTIGLIDMMGAGKNIINMNYGSYTLETYLALFAIYWVLTKLIETGFGLLESRLSIGTTNTV